MVAVLLDRLGVLFERLGAPAVPDVFNWLSRSPVVLEGVLEMIEVNVKGAIYAVRAALPHLLRSDGADIVTIASEARGIMAPRSFRRN